MNYKLLEYWFNDVGYEPSKWAKEIHEALLEKRLDKDLNPVPNITILGGGIQAGKSWTGGHHMFAVHALHPKGVLWIVGETYDDTRQEFKYLVEAGIKAGVLNRKKVTMPNNPAPSRAVFNNGCIIRTLSSADASRLAGESPDGVLMVEAGRQSYNAFTTLVGRVIQHNSWLLVSGTFESYKGRWFPDLWRECQGDNIYYGKSYSLPTYANPANYPDGVDDPKIIAARNLLSEEEFAERFLGVPRPTIGVVFPEFRRSKHVRAYADYDPMYPVRLWVDPGFHPSSYAVLYVQVVGDQVRIFKEIYEQGLVNDQIIDLVINDPMIQKVDRVVIDVAAKAHSGAQEPAVETWRRRLSGRGIPVVHQYVKIEHGLQRTHDKLRISPLTGEAFLVFHPRVESAIWELEEGYKFSVKKDGMIGKASGPIDANNHAAKAIAYGIINQYGAADEGKLLQLKPRHRRMRYDMGRAY